MIYVVEDEPSIREIEVLTLEKQGFRTKAFGNYASFHEQMFFELPDLIVLDIMLPDKDGLDILWELKRNPKTKKIPVLLASAKSQDVDVIRGLDDGADDYLPKPFNYYVLASHVKALLRRLRDEDSDVTEYRGIFLDRKARECKVNGERIELNMKEFELLNLMLRNAGLTMSRDQLMDALWGTDYYGESRTLDTHMNRVR